MSNPYPSRRELRLQRQREERSKLRDAETERWTAEQQARESRKTETDADTKASGATTDHDDNVVQAANESTDTAPADQDPVATATDQPSAEASDSKHVRPRRRADSEVVSTGMIPLITKPQVDPAQPKPRSRRELRALEARRAAELTGQDSIAQPPLRPARRATSPQLTPPPVPATSNAPVLADPPTEPVDAELVEEHAVGEEITIEVSDSYQESAAEITDMSGLDTIEIRRAELRTETERLTQEILQLGQSNPNVIDPVLLRRQKELAEKSKELQDLETAAIAIVEESTRAAQTDTDDATTDETNAVAVLGVESPDKASTETAERDVDAASTTDSPRRRARRAQAQRAISGPFDVVDQEATDSETPATEAVAREPRSTDPIDATQAHGLDSLDAKDFEAPERRLVITAAAVFVIGIIALIIALILFTR